MRLLHPHDKTSCHVQTSECCHDAVKSQSECTLYFTSTGRHNLITDWMRFPAPMTTLSCQITVKESLTTGTQKEKIYSPFY